MLRPLLCAPVPCWPVCRALCLAGALLLAGCAGSAPPAPWPGRLLGLLPADALLLGEQHDAAEHQRLQRQAVQWLAARGQLAAVVIEMAEHGHGTRGLPRQASQAQARAALQWNDAAWPWSSYGPVVMAAVAAGVPVLGGNLPRSRLRAAMDDAAWDRHLPAPALQRQYDALRQGHCGLLPEAQLVPMARMQIARDASLARTVQQALHPGQSVLLLAGNGHVLRRLGVPTHWPASLVSKVVVMQTLQTQSARTAIDDEADMVITTPALPPRDACAVLRRSRSGMAAPPALSSASPAATIAPRP
ncbi:hypothetical protein D5045_16430 [Verminephrobacter eiseniae]|uniref:ChaN family lipoprotein n=1 Tax=Verminephrobacter eiseniae TaxID=364317 RepID=UPI002237A61E|nr:ChaN family lipoprotein [Verminephrobacter eiseniae]MCW5261700.1 hypothetical protein [Verminephrobacter eiseniae]